MSGNDTQEILDLFFAKDGHAPDWAALMTRISLARRPHRTLLEVLQATWAVYETDDVAAQKTLLWVLTSTDEVNS